MERPVERYRLTLDGGETTVVAKLILEMQERQSFQR
jgi:hypothetical protein